MRKYGIVLGSAMLLLTITTSIRANETPSVKYPEPPRSKDVPSHLVWNEDTGGYYDPEAYEWDPVNRVYKERFIITDVPIPDEWLESVEKSDSPVEQALINYYKEKVANQTVEDIISNQFLTPSTKKALRHLVASGPEHVDEMLNMIENHSLWSRELIYAIQEIEGLSSSELQYFDPAPEGMKQWAEQFRAWTAGKKE